MNGQTTQRCPNPACGSVGWSFASRYDPTTPIDIRSIGWRQQGGQTIAPIKLEDLIAICPRCKTILAMGNDR